MQLGWFFRRLVATREKMGIKTTTPAGILSGSDAISKNIFYYFWGIIFDKQTSNLIICCNMKLGQLWDRCTKYDIKIRRGLHVKEIKSSIAKPDELAHYNSFYAL